LEDRGIQVVTTSGALGTLLFGIATFSQGANRLDVLDQSYLVAALILFVIAAVLGLLTNLPQGQIAVSGKELRKWVANGMWDNYDPQKASLEIAKQKVEMIIDARPTIRSKGLFLLVAIAFEVLAVVCVAAAVSDVVEHHPAVPWVLATVGVTVVIALVVFTRITPTVIEQLRIAPPLTRSESGLGESEAADSR
jgi:Na+/melibiose symporter-like transporter